MESFISVLRAQLGKPYVYGNSGPNSFDCSGLVYYCLRQVGVNVDRLSAAGYSEYPSWQRIDGMGNLRRGDLMFFWNDAHNHITHVAVCLGGNQLIHASSSAGSVVVSNYNSWYQSHFAWGKRVF